MKKIIAVALIPLTAACANYCHKDSCKEPAEPAPLPVVYEAPAVEVNPCACVNEPEPYREVKHPRIVEEIPAPAVRRPCDDHQMLDCGCGQCDTFHPYHPQVMETSAPYMQVAPQPLTYIPPQPEAYKLAANRAFNRFVKEAYDIYSKDPNIKVYFAKPVLKDSDLPEGISAGVDAFKGQVATSRIFVLTDDESAADYVVNTTAEWLDTPSSEVPSIKYVTTLTDKDGKEAGVWSQIIKRADNKSWI